MCYGSNELGSQTEPCVFNIIPAGKQTIFFNFPHQHPSYLHLFTFSFFSFVSFVLPATYLTKFYILYVRRITGKPDPLSNCSILNQTFDMLQIACQEGYDGGLEQSFIAEVYVHGHKSLFSSVNSK